MVLRIKSAFPAELAEASAGVDSSSTPAELASIASAFNANL